MGCGCLVLLASGISPRLGLFVLWVFTDRLTLAFESFWLGLAGFLLLPWTTLAWAIAYAPFREVQGFGLLLVAFGFIMDVTSWFGLGRGRTDTAS